MAGTAHPDLPAEQAYVDRAYACLDRMREAVARVVEAPVDDVTGQALEKFAAGRLRTFEESERGLCFGRLDLEGADARIYVGRRWVHDDDGSILLANWQAPAARHFST